MRGGKERDDKRGEPTEKRGGPPDEDNRCPECGVVDGRPHRQGCSKAEGR